MFAFVIHSKHIYDGLGIKKIIVRNILVTYNHNKIVSASRVEQILLWPVEKRKPR